MIRKLQARIGLCIIRQARRAVKIISTLLWAFSRQDKNHPQHQNAAVNFHNHAANHHEQAMKSHLEAARMRELANHEASATHALTAHAHALNALRHSEDALNEHANIQSSVQRP